METEMTDICSIITCPLCAGALSREGGSLVCRNGEKVHTYDVAKEGYVNLLPPGKGRNAKSGDEAAMIRARSEFLATGAYDRFSDEAARLISVYAPCRDGVYNLVDSGCGEGYHSIRITKELARLTGKEVLCAAFDASKHGAAAGAKASVRAGSAVKGGVGIPFECPAKCAFMTGNIFALPVKSHSISAVISMFAPLAWDEMDRLLFDDGIVVAVSSGEEHLLELRQVIYENVLLRDSKPACPDSFEKLDESVVSYSITLDSSEKIMSLFGMTPFCHRTPAAAVKKLKSLDSLTVKAESVFTVFRKKNAEWRLL